MSHHLGEVLAEVIRSGLVESFHTGHLCIINSDGSTGVTAGNIEAPFFPSSAIKSIQVAALVRAGLKLSPEQLAMACASHSGSADHMNTVEAILSTVGLSFESLRNVPALPLDPAERMAWGEKAPSKLAQNCSGTHAAMLATCLVNGWELNAYTSVGHPVQLAIRAELETLTRAEIHSIAINGCGDPTFAATAKDFAGAMHRMRVSDDAVYREVIAACLAYPDLIAGPARVTTPVMRNVPGLLMKDGVEGVQVFSIADGRACVFKLNDGGYRAGSTIISAVLTSWGIDSGIPPTYLYGGGRVVGEVRSTVPFKDV
jgi:L-asparaginase II